MIYFKVPFLVNHFFPFPLPNNMNTPARRRLMRDFKRLNTDPPEGISGSPIGNNILQWQAVIFGCVIFTFLFFFMGGFFNYYFFFSFSFFLVLLMKLGKVEHLD